MKFFNETNFLLFFVKNKNVQKKYRKDIPKNFRTMYACYAILKQKQQGCRSSMPSKWSWWGQEVPDSCHITYSINPEVSLAPYKPQDDIPTAGNQ